MLHSLNLVITIYSYLLENYLDFDAQRRRPSVVVRVYKSTSFLVMSQKCVALRRVRDWSLITGRGGYKTGGGAQEVLPL